MTLGIHHFYSARAELPLLWQMNSSASGALYGWLDMGRESLMSVDSNNAGLVSIRGAGPESQGLEDSTFFSL